MKSFFKYLLASILGFFIASFIIVLIFIGIISAAISSGSESEEIKANSILMLKLDQPINDRKSNMPKISLNLANFGTENALGLNEILKNIHKARLDTNIRGIYLQLSGLQAGVATIEEIRNALLDFKKSGKFILSFSDTYTQGSYYLASAADKIYLVPTGSVNLIGLSAELTFYKKTLDKLDIEPEIIRHGKFKSAVEPFMYDKMSPENREQIRTYVGSIWNHMVNNIAESRKINVTRVNSFADSLLLWDNKAVVQAGLIDALLYKDQVLDTLAKLVDVKKAKDIEFVSYQKYLKVPQKSGNKGYSSNKIAVVYAEGDIVSGEQGEGFIGSEKIARALRMARQDSSIKAIVFRINSGGGSALASEVIWREVDLARRVKPVIASMGDVAASGGYYIASAADTIVASPNTITGSIGVFGLLMNAENFFENKLGITTDVEKTNQWSDFGTVFRPLSETERLVLQHMVDETYQVFVSHVAEGRNLKFAEVDAMAEGRVWSGSNAKERKLVDVFGGLETAIKIAAEKAKLGEKYRITELPKQEEAFAQIMKELTGEVKQRFVRNELGAHYNQYMYIKKMLESDRIQARMPFEISVH